MVNSVWLSTRSPKPAVLMSLCDLGRHNARGSFALQAVLLNTELPTINPHDMRIMPWWKHVQMAELPFFLSGGYSVPFTELSKTIRFIITFYCKTSPAFQFVFDIQISPLHFRVCDVLSIWVLYLRNKHQDISVSLSWCSIMRPQLPSWEAWFYW